MTFRRLLSIPVIVALCCASTPAPTAAALSTGNEVQIGQNTDKQIVEETNIISDPLLNGWVDDISAKLWSQTARKDVPYSIKILDVSDVNAFSTLGGFVYMDEGTLDFVQSDDELAGVIGHETGHIERRHAVQNANKAGLLNILFGIGSLFSPFLYRFGQLIEAGAMAKIQRDDEYQADKYGLMLMTRSGYDPDAMVSFMRHLDAAQSAHNTIIDKYFADHPETPKRVGALVGYPELDPKVRTAPQRLAAAIHDEETGRYAIAAHSFTGILKNDPGNTTAAFYLGEAQLALGQTAKGEQNLSDASAHGPPETKALADARIKALRDGEKRLDLLHVDIAPLRNALTAARTTEAQAVAAIATRRDSGRQQAKTLQTRVQDISFGIPDLSNAPRRPGSRNDTLLHNLATMGRALNTAIGKSSEVLAGIGSVERNKEGGLLKDHAEILDEMAAPLKLDVVPPQALSTLPYYPRMLANIAAADADMVRAVDAARGALAILDVSLGDLNAFVRDLARARVDALGDVQLMDYKDLEPKMTKAVDALNRAAVAAAQASQLYNMARSRQLEVRIDLLGLASAPDRYQTLAHALAVRFKNDQPDYDALFHQDLSPGEVAAAAIVAADTNTTPAVIVAEAQSTHRSIVDVANARGMLALSLEIFLGLVYLDYTDDPDKEARDSRNLSAAMG
jgi:Zn-dependent protease with chaperone function